MAHCVFFMVRPVSGCINERVNDMKWLCSVGVAVSLALQPVMAEEMFGNHPLTPQARDAFVTELLKK